MRLLLRVGLVVLAVIFAAVAAYYWVTPASSLLHFVPGYNAHDSAPHAKHAIAALALAAGCLLLLWFSTGKKTESTPPSESAE